MICFKDYRNVYLLSHVTRQTCTFIRANWIIKVTELDDQRIKVARFTREGFFNDTAKESKHERHSELYHRHNGRTPAVDDSLHEDGDELLQVQRQSAVAVDVGTKLVASPWCCNRPTFTYMCMYIIMCRYIYM